METILKVKNLNIELEKEKIICNLSFEIKKGETLTILGPNGAGKTTLLKALMGIFPYKGEINWEKGIKIGYVPQRVPFVKDVPLTVEEFLQLKEFDGTINKSKKEIKEIINLVGFDKNFLKKNISEISSGQYQRVLVAWALLGKPNVVLFDEPTSGIDIFGQETIYQLLERLKNEKKITIILVTHDLNVVFKFSDYVICLNKCPVCQGVPKEVLNPEILSRLYGQEIKFYEHYHEH